MEDDFYQVGTFPAFDVTLVKLGNWVLDKLFFAVYPHPFSMIMPVPYSYEIFPVGLARRSGKYELLGDEEWIGRKTWAVRFSGDVEGAYELLWVDQQTGIILKTEIHRPDFKAGKMESREFTSIVVDGSVNDEKFHAP